MLKKYFLSGIMLLASSVSSVCLANDETVALPYVQSFDSEAVMSEFTVLDLNNDNATWEYAKFGETDYQYVRYRYSSQKADDWLLTPQFYFETEREYTLKFNTWISDTYYNKEYNKDG